jgi:hypothetical protein
MSEAVRFSGCSFDGGIQWLWLRGLFPEWVPDFRF